MDTELLKTFLEVNRTRHFGKAADNLYLTQSAVSARIRLLEDVVGLKLFKRDRNNIQLTPAGQKLLPHAEAVLSAWNRARHEIAVEDESTVAITMGGVPSLWDGFLQEWVQRLVQRQPGLSLTAEVRGTDALVRRVVEETMDIAFVFEAPQMPELIVREIAVVKLLLVSSTAGQRAADAVGPGYVLVDWGTSFAVAHARAYRDAPAALVKMSLGRLAREFILACGGAAYLAEPLVADDLREGRLFLVADAPVIDRSAHAVYSARSQRQEFLLESLSLLSAGREPAAK